MSWIITGSQKNKGLLDEFSGAAAAYSLRNLSLLSDPAVVRVRRDNDNAEQDFTATEVSDGTLAAWVGAGNDGFVRTWYDQSGNGRNATQVTTANQPILVQNGVILMVNNKPQVNFDTTDLLSTSFSRTNYAAFCVFSANSVDSINFCVPINNLITGGIGVRPTLKLYDSMATFNASAANNTVVLGIRLLATSINFASVSNLYKNSLLVSTASGSALSQSQLGLGSIGTGVAASSSIQEVIFYTTDQSANRTAIEANINAHYNIF